MILLSVLLVTFSGLAALFTLAMARAASMIPPSPDPDSSEQTHTEKDSS